MPVETITRKGKRYVVIPESEYHRLIGEPPEPLLPAADERGYYPAAETLRALLARKIIRRRRAVGLTQVELSRRAGVRPETLNRIERVQRGASPATIEKIERALEAAEAQDRAAHAARQAGILRATLNRIEQGRHSPRNSDCTASLGIGAVLGVAWLGYGIAVFYITNESAGVIRDGLGRELSVTPFWFRWYFLR
jgi:transcriptional regulator with XRE-family HTH domain